MAFKFVLFITFAATAFASPDAPVPSYGYQSPQPPQQYAPAKYDFDWSVKDDDSANNYGHQESRDGDNTQGSYYVLLPDGRTQKVTYSVNGDSGFVAEVSYEGEARYEQPQAYRPPQQQQAYKPPQQPQAYTAPQQPQQYRPPQQQQPQQYRAPQPQQQYKPPQSSNRYN